MKEVGNLAGQIVACKSKLKDLPMRVRSARFDVLNSRCRGLWCLLAPKCTCVVLFEGENTMCLMGVWISVMQGLYTWLIPRFLLFISN